MKKTIQNLLVAGFVVFGITQANAQRGMKHLNQEEIQQMKAKHFEKMSEKLELSESQIAQFKEINAKYASQEESVHEKMRALREVNKPKHEAMREEMKNVFTPEQQAKFEKMKGKKHEKGRAKHGMKGERKEGKGEYVHGKKGGDRLEKMKTKLGLSDSQVDQIKSIKEKYRPSDAEKASKKALMDQRKLLKDQKMDEFKQFLNVDQKTKLEEMKGEMIKHIGKMKGKH